MSSDITCCTDLFLKFNSQFASHLINTLPFSLLIIQESWDARGSLGLVYLVTVCKVGEFFGIFKNTCYSPVVSTYWYLALLSLIALALILSQCFSHLFGLQLLLERGYVWHIVIWKGDVFSSDLLDFRVIDVQAFGILVEEVDYASLVRYCPAGRMGKYVSHEVKTVLHILLLVIWNQRIEVVYNNRLALLPFALLSRNSFVIMDRGKERRGGIPILTSYLHHRVAPWTLLHLLWF